MFIKTVKKKNKYSPKEFEYHYLVESIRTDKGPRQRFIYNLGKLDLPREEWPLLARRINEILHGQERIFAGNPDIDKLAINFAQKIIRKYEVEYQDTEETYLNVNIDTVSHTTNRTIGGEYSCYSYLKKLQLDHFLSECQFTQREIQVSALLIISRLLSPGSERHTKTWAEKISALDELMGCDFSQLSLNTLYKTMDSLYKHKEKIEEHLNQRERALFGLEEKIILYDLTNTYFEGRSSKNRKAKFGRSKDKRNNNRLLTLGLVVDEMGFPKTSKIFAGNQSEPQTLNDMLKELTQKTSAYKTDRQKPTVVLDAGIGTEDNLAQISQDYNYICVSRRKIKEQPLDEDFVVIKQTKENKVEAKRMTQDGEVFLYCKSELKAKKEGAIQSRLEQFFEEGLEQIKSSLNKKGGTKKYKVLERIGRLREKYKKINRFYEITVSEKNGRATDITWNYVKEQSNKNFSGTYYLRTNRTDLSEKQIWQLYTMLTELEDGFRTLKSELNLRPIYHKKENRGDAHIFIAVLAYHILRTIQLRLKKMGYHYRWPTIRNLLGTHQRSTIQLHSKTGKTIHLRKCSEPESFHRQIYDALQLDYTPCSVKKSIF